MHLLCIRTDPAGHLVTGLWSISANTTQTTRRATTTSTATTHLTRTTVPFGDIGPVQDQIAHNAHPASGHQAAFPAAIAGADLPKQSDPILKEAALMP